MSAERGTYDVDEHQLSIEDLASRYVVDINTSNIASSQGLPADIAAARLQKHGRNVLSPPKEAPEIIKYLKQFLNPLMLLLLLAALFLYMAYGLQKVKDRTNLILGSALVVVVVATCSISYLQERSAGNVMKSLKKMLPQKCIVTRGGKEFRIEATDLVPGDLVRLCIGDRVPADVRIIQTSDLKVECSALTGESDLVPASVEKKHDLPQEARNIVFMSSLCMNGEGRGVVIRTGDESYIGKIASLASETSGHKTTMAVEVHRLVMFVVALAVVTGLAFFSIGVGRYTDDPLSSFISGFILVIVANVPEGLPATVTSCLMLTALKLKEKNVLIKKTDIVENLGVATIIASDKTGTLTQNKMTVENIWCNTELRPATSLLLPTNLAAGPSQLARISARSLSATSKNSLAATPIKNAEKDGGVVAPGPGMLARVSRDPMTGMAAGRTVVPRGDGTVEMVKMGNSGLVSTSFSAFSVRSSEEAAAVSWGKSSALMKLVTIATVCNRAKFSSEDTPTGATALTIPPATTASSLPDAKILGDATDAGLLRFCETITPSAVMRLAYPKLFEIPFNSANKWALVVSQVAGDPKQHLVMMKGAPEIILSKCSHFFHNNKEKVIDSEFRSTMMGAYEQCGVMGERVIGFAYQLTPSKDPELYQNSEGTDHAPPTEGLVYMGLISLVDPPREGVRDAVLRCRSAGIRVAMVTGDHPLTAEAIARKVGIITLQTAREVAAETGIPEDNISRTDARVGAIVVSGQMLRALKAEQEWDAILDHPEIVFARTSPQQKLQIVENLQRRGEVVAVTGDGVNDAPALKKAQIGVSMGSANASDVAREAADIVLLDDQFPSIVMAIEEGRVIYDNLKKTIAYTLAHLLPEIFPIFLNLALGFPVGLGGLMILSIDLATEQGPAISLANEHAEALVMERPPRNLQADRLISPSLLRYCYLIAGVAEMIACLTGYFIMFLWEGVPISDVIWGIDNNHFDYKNSDAEPLKLDCHLGKNGEEKCKHVYDAHKQTDIWRNAQTCWFVTLVMCQLWHVFMCKTRQASVFTHGLFKNYVTVIGVTIAVMIVVIIAYTPALHSIFTSNSLPGIGWLPNLIFLAFILPYTEVTKYIARKDPNGWVAKHITW